MSEVVGSERGEGGPQDVVWPTECSPGSTRCSSRPGYSAYMQLSHRTHGGPLFLGFLGGRIRLTGWLAGRRTVGIVTFGNWKRFILYDAWKERTVCFHSSRATYSVSIEGLSVVSSMPTLIGFEVGFETPCGCCSIVRVATQYSGLH